jgi:hypothetical protein
MSRSALLLCVSQTASSLQQLIQPSLTILPHSSSPNLLILILIFALVQQPLSQLNHFGNLPLALVLFS